MQHLFVYGTLMVPEVALKICGRVPTEKALITNHQSFKIYIDNDVLFYPALVPVQGINTEGMVFRDISDEELKMLDAYEGNEYKRKLCTVETATGTIDAWCYLWFGGAAYELRDSWSIDWFITHFLDDFMAGSL